MKPLVKPTIWAEKYGLARERWLQNHGKSGISPLILFDGLIRAPSSLNAWKLRVYADLYQRVNLEGFTVADLVRAGAVGEQMGIRASNLQELHELFERERWTLNWPAHLVMQPLGHGRPGTWNAGEDEVWRVLRPCLALASRFVSYSDLWYWWDAQAWGDIFPARRNANGRTFSPYSVFLSARGRNSRMGPNRYFEELSATVRFAISSAHVNPESGMPIDEDTWDVKAVVSRERGNRLGRQVGHSTVFIAYERLAPMLFDDLTRSEMLISQFEIGVAIVEELAHLIHQQQLASRYMNAPVRTAKLEYRRQPELGDLLLNMAFKGTFFPVTKHRNQFWHLREKPTLAMIYRKDEPIPAPGRLRPVSNERKSYAIPLTWISDIQQSEYWNSYVRPYGELALQPYPLTYGIREDLDMPWPERLSADGDVVMHDYEPELDILSRYTSFLAHNVPENTKALFGEIEAPRRKDARVLRAESVMAALAKSEESDANEMAAWEASYGTNTGHDMEWRNHRLSGQTGEIVFQDQRRDRKFDSKMEPPAEFDAIRALLIEYYHRIALETMLNWIPVPLFLSYIQRSLEVGQAGVTIEALYDFLTYCESHKTLFRFERRGTGLVRRIPNDWPLDVRVGLPTPQYRLGIRTPIDLVVRDIFLHSERSIFNKSGLLDYAERTLYERFMQAVYTYQNRSTLNRNPIPFRLTRDQFHETIATFHQNHILIAIGPQGIYRKLKAGWNTEHPEIRGSDDDGSTSGHSEFTSDSVSSDSSDEEMVDAPPEEEIGPISVYPNFLGPEDTEDVVREENEDRMDLTEAEKQDEQAPSSPRGPNSSRRLLVKKKSTRKGLLSPKGDKIKKASSGKEIQNRKGPLGQLVHRIGRGLFGTGIQKSDGPSSSEEDEDDGLID